MPPTAPTFPRLTRRSSILSRPSGRTSEPLIQIATVVLEVCTNANCTPTPAIGSLLLTAPPANGINFVDALIPGGPYSELWVFDDVGVSIPEGGQGAASISRLDLDKVVMQTPEPASMALLG